MSICIDIVSVLIFIYPWNNFLLSFRPHTSLTRIKNHFLTNMASKDLYFQFHKLVYKLLSNWADEPYCFTLLCVFLGFFPVVCLCVPWNVCSTSLTVTEHIPLGFIFLLVIFWAAEWDERACAAAFPDRLKEKHLGKQTKCCKFYAISIHIFIALVLGGTSLYEPTCQQLQSSKTVLGGLGNAEVTFRAPCKVPRNT